MGESEQEILNALEAQFATEPLAIELPYEPDGLFDITGAISDAHTLGLITPEQNRLANQTVLSIFMEFPDSTDFVSHLKRESFPDGREFIILDIPKEPDEEI